MQGGVSQALGVDKGRNHGSPGSLDNAGIGPAVDRQRPDFGQHLNHTLRRRHFVNTLLESGSLFYIGATFSNQRNQLTIEAINVAAHFIQRSALGNQCHGTSFR